MHMEGIGLNLQFCLKRTLFQKLRFPGLCSQFNSWLSIWSWMFVILSLDFLYMKVENNYHSLYQTYCYSLIFLLWYSIEFTIIPFLRVMFSGIKNIGIVVQPSLPSISKIFPSSQTVTLYLFSYFNNVSLNSLRAPTNRILIPYTPLVWQWENNFTELRRENWKPQICQSDIESAMKFMY